MTIRPATPISSFQGVRAFRHRNYRLFFAGQLISLVGTWMQQVAQAWLILQLTHDPLWLGIVATAQFGPVIVFGLFGGVIADHLPKRKTLLVTQTVSMVLAFVLFGLTATGLVQVWHVMVLAALLGTANAVDMPARQAFAVEMVGREDVTNAVGLNSAVFNASRIVGPAVAGLLIGAFDISVAFLINGISFLAVIAAYLMMREEDLRPVPAMARPTSVRAVVDNLAEGARYVRTTPLVLLAVTVVGLVATFGMNFQVLVPPLADRVLNVGASGYGFLMAASGIGSTVVALGVAFRRRIGPTPIVVGAVALGLGSIVLALSTSYPVSLMAMVIVGGGGIGMAVTANTTIQMVVPDQLRGRVMSFYTTIFAGSVPLGGLLMGAIASAWGVPLALLVGALLSLAVGIGGWVWLRRILAVQRVVRAAAVGVPTASRGETGAAGAPAESPLAVTQAARARSTDS
jgi:MFS family permease